MRRTLWVVVLLLVALGMLAAPALAAPKGRSRGPQPYSLVGQVVGVNTTDKTVTVTVLSGNAVVRPFVGQQQALHTNDRTRFLPAGTTLASLAAGTRISSMGLFAGETFSASQIIVLPKPPEPKGFELVGQVTAVDLNTKVISVQVTSGSSLVKPYIGHDPLALATDDSTRFAPIGTTLGNIAVGTVINASGLYTDSTFLAKRVIVMPQPKRFELVGQVTAVNADSKVISVQVTSGSTLVKPYIGHDPLALATDGSTRFLPTGTTLGSIAVGDKITASGLYTNSTFLATRVTVVSQPKRFSLIGSVLAVDTGTNAISVRVLAGSPLVKPYIGHDPLSLTVNAQTRFLPRGIGLSNLKLGARITADGVYSDTSFIAQRVTALPSRGGR